MPVQVLFTAEEFAFFEQRLLNIGFRRIRRGREYNEVLNDITRLGLIAPPKITGRQVGFIYYSPRGLRVVVWTTFDEFAGQPLENRAGWVLILEADSPYYFTHPLRRTKYFLLRLARYAWIAKWKADHRPDCKLCQARMIVFRKKETRATFWACFSPKHKNPVFENWDYRLPSKAEAFLEEKRKWTRRYNKMRRAQGKSVGAARKKRKRWEITRPENVERIRRGL